MALYTFIMGYGGGVYVDQVRAAGVKRAIAAWVEHVDLDAVDGLTSKSRGVFRQRISEDGAVLLDGLRNAWCTTVTVRNKLALVNIVKTDER